jgi:hypothetical protein
MLLVAKLVWPAAAAVVDPEPAIFKRKVVMSNAEIYSTKSRSRKVM